MVLVLRVIRAGTEFCDERCPYLRGVHKRFNSVCTLNEVVEPLMLDFDKCCYRRSVSCIEAEKRNMDEWKRREAEQ